VTSYPAPGAPTRRPGLVTLLVVLVVIGGIVSLLVGLVTILARNDANVSVTIEGQGVNAGDTGSVALILGIGAIIVGLIYLLVARGLSDGSNVARIIVTVVSLLNIAGGIGVVISQTGNARSSAFGTVWGSHVGPARSHPGVPSRHSVTALCSASR
jgi:hypothetical protein